jgi:hypothetical protein
VHRSDVSPRVCAAVAVSGEVGGFVHRQWGLPTRKDDILHQHLARFTGTERVLFIGQAGGEDGVVPHRETP